MKKYITGILIGILSIAFIVSCKKTKEETPNLDSQTTQFNSDANNYRGESDQADNDVNNQLHGISGFGKGVQPPSVFSSPLCGASVDSTQIASKILYFNFDGVTPCGSPSRTRSGQIKVELISGNLWSDQNSVLKLTFINYKVTRISDSKSIMFNGVKTLKNINGNNWIAFFLGLSKLRYQERAFNIQVSFGSGAQAVWNSARVTEWSYNPSDTRVTFTANGDTTLNGYTHVDSWGTNRFGQAFTTYYNTAITSNTYCGLWRPNTGELIHHVNGNDYKLNLGVDPNGNPSPYACAYGYKVTWTNSSGNEVTVILSY